MNDSDLRSLFHRLREEEALRLPSPRTSRLPSPRVRGEGAPKARMRGWLAATAVVIIAIVLSVTNIRRPEPAESILTWKPPTDVLLLTPGSELLTTVPRIPDLPERK